MVVFVYRYFTESKGEKRNDKEQIDRTHPTQQQACCGSCVVVGLRANKHTNKTSVVDKLVQC
jgi:hypothetical protein